MRSRLLISFAAVWLSSCASVTSPEQFRQAEPATVQICSGKSAAEARDALVDGWRRCWVKGYTQYIPGAGVYRGSSPFYVTVEELPESSTVALVHHSPGLGTTNIVMLADIRRTPTCSAEVSVRGKPVVWRGYAEHAKVWIENPFDRGPGLACL